MRLAALYSGGKDSTYSLYLALKQGHNVKYLITIAPKREDSWMFHHPCIELTKLQAQTMGIQQIWKESSGIKEREVLDLSETVAKIRKEIDGIVSGAIVSEYQRLRIDSICREFGLVNIAPLWGINSEGLLREEIDLGFEIIITAVSSDGFDEKWLGRKLDNKAIEDMKILQQKFGLNLSGEGGEYETLVVNCPLFRKPLDLSKFKKIWDKKTNSGRIQVSEAFLKQD